MLLLRIAKLKKPLMFCPKFVTNLQRAHNCVEKVQMKESVRFDDAKKNQTLSPEYGIPWPFKTLNPGASRGLSPGPPPPGL